MGPGVARLLRLEGVLLLTLRRPPPTHQPIPPARPCTQTLVRALILLRNRQQLAPTQLLPLLFRLFRVQDKGLRQLVFRHVTSDIKNANKKQRNERLNRAVQNFMYRCAAGGRVRGRRLRSGAACGCGCAAPRTL